MAENKKTSQLDPLDLTAFAALFRMAFEGDDYNLSVANLMTMLGIIPPPNPVTIPSGGSRTLASFGEIDAYHFIRVHYCATRGSKTQAGIIELGISGSTIEIIRDEYNILPYAEDASLGLSFNPYIVYDMSNLTIAADDSDANDTTFIYKVEKL